ncbi:MAG TPA: DUF4147 domain-containing protein [Polyangia bacterium]|jgi:hydroxypyruvate reductase|nr:DUF4147 domain-containing protein [Polyangia bacterium]
MNGHDIRPSLVELYARVAARLDGETLVRDALGAEGTGTDGVTHVLALGKVALPMWRGLGDGGPASGGARKALAVLPAPLAPLAAIPGLRVLPSDHPHPTERAVAAAEEVLAFVRAARADAGARLLVLLSGGTSSLLCAPAGGLSVADKRAGIAAVAAAGATIGQLNAVRKHLSQIKGGRLALATDVPTLVLAMSDVIGDDPATIGSGPLSPDPTTFADAQRIIARLGAAIPPTVAAHLEAGARGLAEESPPPGDRRLDHVRYRVIAGPDTARAEARRQAVAAGWSIGDLPANTELTVEHLATIVVDRARAALATASAAPQLLIGNGEPTIKVSGDGRGGRATHLALLVARGLAQWPETSCAQVAFLAAGTDDRDGNSDVSGAVVDGTTWARALAENRDPQGAIDRCDSASLLAALSATVRGPGTSNLLDLHFLAIGPR